MKPTTTSVKSILETEAIIQGIEKLLNSNPNYEAHETNIKEAYEGYLDIKSLILESIEKGIFEEIPFNRRNAILSSLNAIKQYYNNITQFVSHFNSLKDQVNLTILSRRVNEDLDIAYEIKELNRLKRKYKTIVESVEDSDKIKKNLEKLQIKSQDIINNLNELASKGKTFDNNLDRLRESVELNKKSIDDSEQEIENRKKEIIAFSNNIEKSEEKIENIQTNLNNQIAVSISEKTEKAENLIKQAEEALELKQTEGISKAYSSRLAKLTSEKTKSYWLYASIVFVFITLIIGYLLTGGQISIGTFNIGFSASNNLAFIIGRIVLTGIGITGAVFCANRYVHLKNLEEDYEYKVVLSKSILAFSNKIKELDESKLAEYLTKVLHDLHQDPMRERKKVNNKSDLITMNHLTEIFEKWKLMN